MMTYFFSKKRAGENFYNSIIILLFAYTISKVIIFPYISITTFILIILCFMINVSLKYSKTRSLYQTGMQDIRLIKFYLFIQILVIIRGVLLNYDSVTQFITSSFTNQYSTLALLLPFVVLIDARQLKFNLLIKLMTLFMFVFVYVVISNYESIFLEQYVHRASIEGQETYGTLVGVVGYVTSFFFLSAFLLYLPQYTNKTIWNLGLFCLGLAIVIVMIGARRSSIAYFVMIALSVGFYYMKLINKNKITTFLLMALLFGGIIYYAIGHMDSTFSILKDRGLSNSRESVESEFWTDMGNGLNWIFGKGLNGTYYGASTSFYDSSLSVNRNLIETGYLNIILSGGVISLALYLLIMLRAAKRGWYNSNNNLTKSFSIFILINSFALIPFGLITFSLTFFIVWVGVSICNSPYIRSLNDNEIKQLFFE